LNYISSKADWDLTRKEMERNKEIERRKKLERKMDFVCLRERKRWETCWKKRDLTSVGLILIEIFFLKITQFK